MFRKDTWVAGYYMDHHDKYECLECENSFIVGRENK